MNIRKIENGYVANINNREFFVRTMEELMSTLGRKESSIPARKSTKGQGRCGRVQRAELQLLKEIAHPMKVEEIHTKLQLRGVESGSVAATQLSVRRLYLHRFVDCADGMYEINDFGKEKLKALGMK